MVCPLKVLPFKEVLDVVRHLFMSWSLQRAYQQAGSGGWKDQKYAALGGIVEECCSALTKPIAELQECMSKLNDLLQAVGEYESVSL